MEINGVSHNARIGEPQPRHRTQKTPVRRIVPCLLTSMIYCSCAICLYILLAEDDRGIALDQGNDAVGGHATVGVEFQGT